MALVFPTTNPGPSVYQGTQRTGVCPLLGEDPLKRSTCEVCLLVFSVQRCGVPITVPYVLTSNASLTQCSVVFVDSYFIYGVTFAECLSITK